MGPVYFFEQLGGLFVIMLHWRLRGVLATGDGKSAHQSQHQSNRYRQLFLLLIEISRTALTAESTAAIDTTSVSIDMEDR